MTIALGLAFALLVGGLAFVVWLGLKRRGRWIYVRLLGYNGKPLANERLTGRFAQGGTNATYMGSNGDQPQYMYEKANDPDLTKPIGQTDSEGCFQYQVGTSGLHAIEFGPRVRIGDSTFAHYVVVQHVSVEGGYPERPFVVRLSKDSAVALPE